VLIGDVYQARAAARERLKLYPEAAGDMERAIEFVRADQRPSLRVQWALLLLDAGQVEKGVAEAEAVLAKPEELSAEVRYDAGRLFAKAAKAEKSTRAEEYARRAVKELTAAEKAGHFDDPKRRTLLEADPGLAHLRGRDDFDALRARVRRP
jgi:hypothetical protein